MISSIYLHVAWWSVGRNIFVRNYNPKEGRGSKKPVSREQAMEELLQVVRILTFSWIIVDLFILFPFIRSWNTLTGFLHFLSKEKLDLIFTYVFTDTVHKTRQFHTQDNTEKGWLCSCGIRKPNPWCKSEKIK